MRARLPSGSGMTPRTHPSDGLSSHIRSAKAADDMVRLLDHGQGAQRPGLTMNMNSDGRGSSLAMERA